MDKPDKSASMGVRARLLLAFLGISMFSLVAAASGLYSLSQVGGALSKITEHRVPEALSWLELSRRVGRCVEGRIADHDQEPHAGKLQRLRVRFWLGTVLTAPDKQRPLYPRQQTMQPACPLIPQKTTFAGRST